MSDELRWLWQGERRTGAYRDSAATAGANIAGLRMLVVDALPVHRLLLSGLLKVLFPGSAVDETGDCARAQSMLRGRHYDVVLSNWIMPGMGGSQLANWLRPGETPQQPFVLFSAHDEIDEIAPLFSMQGIDGYLVKPFDQTAIREVISVAVGALTPAA